MSDELVLLEKIERYHTGAMAPAERSQWEQILKTDETLRTEVLAYAPVFGAWQALRNDQFRQSLGAWEAEWQEVEESEAIENWLTSQSNDAWVNQKMQADASFAEKVNQHKQLLEGFSAARGQNFHSAMQSWESKQAPLNTTTENTGATIRPLWRRWAAAAVITPLLILVAATYWYANSNYSNQSLVESYYQQPSIGNTLSGQGATIDELTAAFNTAHDHLYNRRYPDALKLFEQVETMAATSQIDDLSKQYFIDNAQWSKALALLGNDKAANAEELLAKIAGNPSHAYHQQALELQKNLHSFLRRLSN